MNGWAILTWAGAAVSLAGVGLLVWCILQAMKARRAAADEEALKARLQALAAVNMGALAVSAMGLMMVVIGITLS